jgi:hypothetical protein
LNSGTPLVLGDDYISGYEKVRGTMGYTSAKRYHSGAIEQYNPLNPSMGIHVTYSSQAILKACEEFICEQDEILLYLATNGNISRLDLAMDIDNIRIDIRSVFHELLQGVIKSRAKIFDYVESAQSGQEIGARTAYIGSMKKRKKLLRIYDKGMQMNLERYKTRLELETHGAIAKNAASGVLSHIHAIPQAIAGMIKGYADFTESEELGKFFTNVSAIKLALPQYKKSDTAKWLIEVVAPTLAREASKDYNVAQEFLKAFQYEYDLIQKSLEYNEGY